MLISDVVSLFHKFVDSHSQCFFTHSAEEKVTASPLPHITTALFNKSSKTVLSPKNTVNRGSCEHVQGTNSLYIHKSTIMDVLNVYIH